MFLIAQHGRFAELSEIDPRSFASICLDYQDNGYADKLGAYRRACFDLGLRQSNLPKYLLVDCKEYYAKMAVASDSMWSLTAGQVAKIESSGLASFLMRL